MNTKIQVVETTDFAKKIASLLAQHSLLLDDYKDLKKELAENPEKGAILTGTGGVRKIRLKSISKGKSGGFRICYFYYVFGNTIYLLFVFQKNEMENLNTEQKTALKKIANAFKEKK